MAHSTEVIDLDGVGIVTDHVTSYRNASGA
jgi:hypothetical protein